MAQKTKRKQSKFKRGDTILVTNISDKEYSFYVGKLGVIKTIWTDARELKEEFEVIWISDITNAPINMNILYANEFVIASEAAKILYSVNKIDT